MLKFIKDMLTETNGETYCVLRIGAALVILVGLGLEIFKALHPGIEFDIEHFGIGSGAILGAAGGAFKLKPDSATQ